MNQLKYKIGQLREKHGVVWELIEQDYVLAWMLAGIAAIPELRKLLIFKGGTALKKAYFGKYRYSQDLDFTIIESLPEDEELEALMQEACKQAMQLQKEYDYPVIISCKRYAEKMPHPHNQKAFTISAQYEWHREPAVRVMVEMTTQEKPILPPVEKAIIHEDYGEKLEASLMTYRLEEIIAEKVRAILQFAAKLHERGWGRSRARDYYDLRRIFKDYREHIEVSLLPDTVSQKCAFKDVVFSGPADLFSPPLMQNLDEAWLRWLKPFVPDLQPQNVVVAELREELEKIWK